MESSSKGCWRRQAGWVPPVAAETRQHPAWSVADEETTFARGVRRRQKNDCSANIPWEHKEKKGRIQVGGGEMYKLAIHRGSKNMLGHSGFARWSSKVGKPYFKTT